MNQPRKNENNTLHIRRCIQTIDDSINQLEKARASLVALLPRNKFKAVDYRIKLPDGRIIGPGGKVIEEKDDKHK